MLNAIDSRNSYTYNASGLLETAVNARGQETAYTYYKNGWIKSFTDELGTVSYTYDGNGNVLTVTDENGTITRTYDEMNRVTEYTDFRGNTIRYSYDQIGNLVALTYPGGRIVRYTYDKTGRVLTVTDWNDNVTSYSYDRNGRLTKTTRPDGSVETRTYDAAGKLLSQVDQVGETVINARDYIYDESGNIINATMSNGTEYSNLTSAEMEYDSANRLIKYNGETVEYDADGNMTYGPLNGTMAEFTYDCRNRLVSAGGVTYAYDAENQRISKTANDIKTSFVIDTSGALSRILTQETAGVTTYYVYGTGLISQEQDGKELYYHFNNIGSTEAVTDSDGTIVETYQYGPYGELTSKNKCGILFLYNGEYGVATDENGLYYMRARYYNPEIKRFINQDVVIGSIAESPSMNRYAYVQGNPISLVDPFGLCPMVDWRGMGHFVLGALSLLTLIPTPATMAIGAIAAIANAAWYFHDGQTFEGICSLLCVLPVFGPTIGQIGMVTIGFMNIGKMNYDNWNRYVIGDEIYTWDQAKQDLLTGTLSIAAIYGGAKGLGWDEVEVPTRVKGSVNLGVSTLTSEYYSNEAHNVVSYMKLKEQYHVTELSNDVVDSLTQTGNLPSNYITKDVARSMGWQDGKALANYAPGKAIGGDVFANTTNVVPSSSGRVWYEADVGLNYAMGRNKNPGYRILYSNDGLIYGTFDHYDSAFPIYPYPTK